MRKYEGPVLTYTLTDVQVADVARQAVHRFHENGTYSIEQLFGADHFGKLEFDHFVRVALKQLCGPGVAK